VRTVADEDIWTARASSRLDLVKYARARFELQLAQRGVSPEVVSHSAAILDPDILTLGFARRFATYKRPNLLLRQPDRLRRLLTDPARPTQLLVAGKAHPDDEAGQALIAEWVRFAGGAAVRPRVVYLEDYDITMAQELVRGVDVWINTPRRPFEACGTSGMKVLVNGGLNVSVLDGWWAEAYAPDVGWAISDTRDDTGPNSDAEDTEDLYRVLEQEIVPLFYERDATGIPRRWLNMVRASLSRLAPRFSASRMVAEYDERLYKPAEAALAHRIDDGAARAVELAAWEERVRLHLPQVRWGRVEMRLEAGDLDVEVEIYWDDLDPVDVAVELYADPIADRPAVRAPMRERRLLPGTAHGRVFGVRLTADRPVEAFTPRLVPREPDPGIQGELPLVLWHH
jgi:starch phosphorylase